MSNYRHIEKTAAAWLSRRDRGDWSQDAQAGLDEWLRTATAHRVVFLRLEAAWQHADRLKALKSGATVGQIPPQGAWSDSPGSASTVDDEVTPRTRRRSQWTLGLAASLMLCAVGGVIWYVAAPRGGEFRTVVGGVEGVPLNDGSRVTLNTDSEVRVAETDKERSIELERGEAFFQVAKDPKRPFVVRAGKSRIIAVGTQFSVRREGEAVSVVVLEGWVRVERDGSAATLAPTMLTAGAVARSDGAGVLVQEKPLSEAEATLSWRSGFLTFHETPLGVAVAEFNRYSTRKIVIDDPSVANLKIGGNFRISNADAFIRLLESGLPIRVEQQADRILLRGS
jgi:transmembrane sensor